MRFLSIGECMAELAPASVAGNYTLGFAGDTFNTAWFLARIRPDADVAFFTAAGTDTISGQMRDAFVDGGILTDYVQTIPDRTVGLYLISLDNGERSFSYWRGQSAARQLADDAGALAHAMENSDTIYFSGITLAILDAPARATLLDEMRTARAAGKTIAFDPNLRPRLWTNDAEMTSVIMEGATVADIVLPSFEDEADHFGDADPQATADRYLAVGATTVVVKNGADDVLFVEKGETGIVPVTAISEVVDTTAAGDSFNAGVFAGLASGSSLADAIALACRLSGLVVQGKGALVPVNAEALEG